jgi:hypothetical protein
MLARRIRFAGGDGAKARAGQIAAPLHRDVVDGKIVVKVFEWPHGISSKGAGVARGQGHFFKIIILSNHPHFTRKTDAKSWHNSIVAV